MSFDVKCHELALAFLEDYDTHSESDRAFCEKALAQEIQTRIEEKLEDFKHGNLITYRVAELPAKRRDANILPRRGKR